jgi:hypothetical protein
MVDVVMPVISTGGAGWRLVLPALVDLAIVYAPQ